MSILAGDIYHLAARIGLEANIPTFLRGEIGWTTDTRVFHVGDLSPTPPRIMTTKSTGSFNYDDITRLQIAGVTFENSRLDGVNFSDMDMFDGLIVKRPDNSLGNAVLTSLDGTLFISNPDGADPDEDVNLAINFAALPLASADDPGIFAFPSVSELKFLRDSGLWETILQILGFTPENRANKNQPNGYAGLNASGNIAGYVKADGSIPMAGNVNVAGFRVTNVGNPVSNKDAVTLASLNARAATFYTGNGDFRGVHASLAALTAAFPSGSSNSWAIIAKGGTIPNSVAVWDSDLTPAPGWVELQTSSIPGSGFLLLAGGTLTGPLSFDKANPAIRMNSTAVSNRYLEVHTNAVMRWKKGTNTEAESTGNAGSNYEIIRHADAGTALGTAIKVTRATGVTAFELVPKVGNVDLALVSGASFDTDQVINVSAVLGNNTTEALNNLLEYLRALIVMNPSVLPNGTAGSAYSSTRQDTGGQAPFSYGVSAGSLPPGLVVNATTGALTGIPTAVGDFSFTLRRTGKFGIYKEQPLTITIGSVPLSGNPPAGALSAGVVGTAYSVTFTTAGGVPAYAYSIVSGGIPPGLTLNSSTGVLSGTPSSAGSYSFTLRRTDSLANTLDRVHSINVTTPNPYGGIGSLTRINDPWQNYVFNGPVNQVFFPEGYLPSSTAVFNRVSHLVGSIVYPGWTLQFISTTVFTPNPGEAVFFVVNVTPEAEGKTFVLQEARINNGLPGDPQNYVIIRRTA